MSPVGDVYVADTGNHRIDQFTETGEFLRAFGADVGGPGVNVCTASCAAGTAASVPGALQDPTFLAVDNSEGVSAGSLYVVDTAAETITKFSSTGALINSWASGGQLAEVAGEPFTKLSGLSIDSFGNLAVFSSEGNALFLFSEAGEFLGKLTLGERGTVPAGLGIDANENFFKANGNRSVEKLDGSGSDIGQVTASEAAAGLAVDASSGELYVDVESQIENYAFTSSGAVINSDCAPGSEEGCKPTDSFGEGQLEQGGSLAVNQVNHTIYAVRPGSDEILAFEAVSLPDPITGPAEFVTASSAIVNGTVNPNGVALKASPAEGCFFEVDTVAYKPGDPPHGSSFPCEAPNAEEIGAETTPVAVHAQVSGLSAATTYHFRLVVANGNGSSQGGDASFLTLGPKLTSEEIGGVTATSAKVTVGVNTGGEDTEFWVEYVDDATFLQSGYSAASRAPVNPRTIEGGSALVPVVQQLTGLQQDTLYHARAVASNASATVQGEGAVFRTLPKSLGTLLDDRRYEQVSPSTKIGEVFPPEPTRSLSGTCVFCVPGFDKEKMPMQVSPSGDGVVYEGQPFSGGLASGPNEYRAFRSTTGWLTSGLSEPQFQSNEAREGFKAFSPELSRGVIFAFEPALSPDAPKGEGKSYANLYMLNASNALEALVRSQPPNRSAGRQGENRFDLAFAGANRGEGSVGPFTHVLFSANDSLTPPVPGVAPDAPTVAAEESNLYEWETGSLRLVNVLPGNAAADPNAVFGSGLLADPSPDLANMDFDNAISADGSHIYWSDGITGQVYVRVGGTETIEITDHVGKFLTASSDGSKVLLSDGCLYDLAANACEEDLTDGLGGFQGILGASEDLSRVYFVDTEALTPPTDVNANPVEPEHAEAGADNLYLWSGGAATFIGRLLPQDNGLPGTWRPSPGNRTAQVTPGGEFLAFMSAASLTGYDNQIVAGQQQCGIDPAPSCAEVFEYDAAANGLTCVSCNPTGVRPLGRSTLSLINSTHEWFEQPTNLTNASGRLFFESQDSLSQFDTNGHIQDVYEWEPEGIGSCERLSGCLSLVSSGTSQVDSHFVDATPSGDDAFFITRDRLTTTDVDEFLDLYDARVNGGFVDLAPAPCIGVGCRKEPAPSEVETPLGSVTLTGKGNRPHRAHKKRHRHKRHKRTKHRHSHHRLAKKMASSERGGAK